MKYFLCILISFVLFCVYAWSLAYVYSYGEVKGYVNCRVECEKMLDNGENWNNIVDDYK